MRHTGQAVGLRIMGDSAALGKAAAPDHVGLYNIDRALVHKLLEAEQPHFRFITRNRHIQRTGQLRRAVHIVQAERFLHPENPHLLELFTHADCGVCVPDVVYIDHDPRAIFLCRLAAGPYPFQLLLQGINAFFRAEHIFNRRHKYVRIAPDLDFCIAKSLPEIAFSLRRQFLRILAHAVKARTGVRQQPVAVPAQQLVNRQAGFFA